MIVDSDNADTIRHLLDQQLLANLGTETNTSSSPSLDRLAYLMIAENESRAVSPTIRNRLELLFAHDRIGGRAITHFSDTHIGRGFALFFWAWHHRGETLS